MLLQHSNKNDSPFEFAGKGYLSVREQGGETIEQIQVGKKQV